MNITFQKYQDALNGEKMPRKLKKFILGTKINKTKLKKMISNIVLKTDEYGDVYIYPFAFCPECGCEATNTHDHGVPYPEIWTEDYCLRCSEYVGGADNSRYHHVLEDLV